MTLSPELLTPSRKRTVSQPGEGGTLSNRCLADNTAGWRNPGVHPSRGNFPCSQFCFPERLKSLSPVLSSQFCFPERLFSQFLIKHESRFFHLFIVELTSKIAEGGRGGLGRNSVGARVQRYLPGE